MAQHTKKGEIYQNPQNKPNSHKIYQRAVKMDELSTKFTKFLIVKTLQKLPKLTFLARKYTIWQPRQKVGF
jgi:hypothetical protein